MPSVDLSREDFAACQACSDGLHLFDEMFPDGMIGKWDRVAQLLLLGSPLKNYLAWAWKVGILPMWSMTAMDLRNADFSGLDLSHMDLSYSNLSGANLEGSIITYANLTGCDRLESDSPIEGWNLIKGKLVRA